MLADLTQNQWVAIAWVELLLVYAGYLFYLNWKSRRPPHDGSDR
ncbi:MAG TPA: hypothetical protein VFD39_01585 [Trueperaceae bacterium]|nr:hypothetical protein [Trueperaceae bacterium]